MRRQILLVLPLALGLAACSRCGKGAVAGAPAELTRALPRQAEAVLVVPDLGSLGEKVAVLQRLKLAAFAAQLLGFSTAEELASSVVAQAGVDFRSKEALRQAGIEPDLGLGVALLAGERAYSVVGVHDGRRLEATLTRLARDRLGAGVITSTESDGQRQISFARGVGVPPELSLLLKGGLAFIAAGVSAQTLPTLAALPAAGSLAEEPHLAAGLQRLPKERDLWIHLPTGAGRGGPLQGATFTAKLSPDAVVLRADLPWPGDKGALEVLTPRPGPDLLPLLPRDAFVVARFSGAPALLSPFLPYLEGAHVAKALEESGLDVKGEVLENLEPGAVLSLSVSPSVRLGGGLPALDVRKTNPFRFVQLVVAAAVKDPAKAAQTLARIPPVAARLGARVEPAEREGRKVFLTSYAQGEGAHLGLAGSDVVMAAPESRLLETLGRVGKPADGGPLPDPSLLMKGFDERALALVVDLRRLSDSVKALPSEAWGVGGFAMKATTVRWLEATDDLRALTAGLSAREGALQAELSLRLAPP
jgi:hypothetical protein